MNAKLDNIYAVILAGGSGTRFWPASRRLTPKQLLPLAPGSTHSLLRDTVTRLSPLVTGPHVLISTGVHLLDATRKELSELDEAAFLAEPQAKNTAPCIAWAAEVVAQMDPEAVVCVLPSDQHAADDAGFRAALSQAARCALSGAIVTIGIVPTRPETGYGYVRRGVAQGEGYRVEGFFEKPDLTTAQSYLEDGHFLWNAGIFVFRACDMLEAVKRHLPELHSALGRLRQVERSDTAAYRAAVDVYFESCPKVSIDYGVMEKEANLMVVPGDFGWSDLGSWESAWELADKDQQGNVGAPEVILVDAERNLVKDLRSLNSGPAHSGPAQTAPVRPRKVIALVGVSDLCVIETDDALLILPRERSQDVREVVQRLKESGREDLT